MRLLVIFLFSSLFYLFTINIVYAACGITCAYSIKPYNCHIHVGKSEFVGIIKHPLQSFDPNPQYGNDVDYCDGGTLICSNNNFTDSSNTQEGWECNIVDGCWFLDCSYNTWAGRWDKSEKKKCIRCGDRHREDSIIGDTTGMYVNCMDDTPEEGDDECELACGADIECDEHKPYTHIDCIIIPSWLDLTFLELGHCNHCSGICDNNCALMEGYYCNVQCGADPSCHNKVPGQSCGSNKYCSKNCKCVDICENECSKIGEFLYYCDGDKKMQKICTNCDDDDCLEWCNPTLRFDCNSFDCTSGFTCSITGTTLLKYGDDYTCNPDAFEPLCKDVGSRKLCGSYVCDSNNMCNQITCGSNTYICVDDYGFKWVTQPPQKESNCYDGIDNNCDGKTDCCKSPEISISPTSGIGNGGENVTYQITIKNNNPSGCPSSTFDVVGIVPAGWKFYGGSVKVSAGATATLEINVTSKRGDPLGVYNFTVNVTDHNDNRASASIKAFYVLINCSDKICSVFDTTVYGESLPTPLGETQEICSNDCKTLVKLSKGDFYPYKWGEDVVVTVEFNDSRFYKGKDVSLTLNIINLKGASLEWSSELCPIHNKQWKTMDKVGGGKWDPSTYGTQHLENHKVNITTALGYAKIEASCTLPSLGPGKYLLKAVPTVYSHPTRLKEGIQKFEIEGIINQKPYNISKIFLLANSPNGKTFLDKI